MFKLFDLSGRVAVVTGSTKGMGLEMARALGQSGARVVISGRDGAVSEKVAADLQKEGIDATGIACDIVSLDSVRAFADKVLAKFGRVDTLVLNAAGSAVVGSMLEQGPELFDDVMAGNVRGNLVLVNALAPQMIARRDGSIIFMSSIAARRGSARLALYSISKGATDLAMRNLAQTLGPHNINVNSINPGPVRTDFSRDALWGDPEREKALSATIPMGRIAEAVDVAGVAVLLASQAGRYISGQTIGVDGGATA
ncbi:NAD(P)-dependent dehydrogenase, short-chain alcohol dehydrogenase family [Cupriavidus sp. YR651]|uniref:SDR family NAD(P)-dependent oxidoreductase n=1 Tax=Cupriavidus sp. YR651 TaxID=1855315 RepID=UPI0008848AF6|nr:glucose 1-dehydrogenase [Cupriavidus sp. YR651]SDC91377.1 NAD(P)-dependent dehydrogenase, short-chain alcohol dehydrogenase family [Cupriavidus sp. YR651]